jgi:hypothetical protein
MIDHEGKDLENILKNSFVHIVQDLYPKTSSNIRERLIATMIHRHKGILYRRSRFSDILSNEESRRNVPPEEATSAMSQARSMAMTTTTLDPNNLKTTLVPSVHTSTKRTYTNVHENLGFPSPPPAPEGTIEVICPFCLHVLPSTEVTDVTRWRYAVTTTYISYMTNMIRGNTCWKT